MWPGIMAPCSRTCSRAHLGWFIFQAGTSKPGSVVSRDGLITGAGLIGTLAGEACNKLPGVEGGSDGKGAEHRWVQGARPKGSQDAATVSLPLWCGDGELWGADPPPLTRARGGHAVVTVPTVPRPVLTLLSVTQKHRSQRHAGPEGTAVTSPIHSRTRHRAGHGAALGRVPHTHHKQKRK